jgi:hypothetical protein
LRLGEPPFMRTMYLAYWLVIAGGLAASIVIGLTGQ